MDNLPIISLYLLLTLVQILHIFEEIGLEAYKMAGSLRKYLFVASLLVSINFFALFLMVHDLSTGYVVAVLGAILGVGNGIIHVAGYLKTRSVRGTVGAGVFTAVPYGLVGAIVLYMLIQVLL
jgi:hypothetical protein